MKVYHLFICTMVLPLACASQLNVQLKYDIGFYNSSYTGGSLSAEDNSYVLNRLSSKLEYQFANSFIVALSAGWDRHKISNHLESKRILNNYGSQEQWHSTFIHQSKIQTFRGGLNLGYIYSFGEHSNLSFSISYSHFFVNNVDILDSRFIEKRFTKAEAVSNDPIPYFSLEQYREGIELNEVGYKNKFRTSNGQLEFSIEYRYKFKSSFIGVCAGWSPFNRNFVDPNFVVPLPQQMLSCGVSFGYVIFKRFNDNE